MTNKYPGPCEHCGGTVAAHAGTCKRVGRRWIVAHTDCNVAGEGAVSHVFNIGGQEFYRNKRGRCEDAPCCGCCTI